MAAIRLLDIHVLLEHIHQSGVAPAKAVDNDITGVMDTDASLSGSSEHSVATRAPRDQSIEISGKLPQELFDQVIVDVLELALLPGAVFPHQKPQSEDKIEWQDRQYDVVRPAVLRLNKFVLDKYEKRMWRENVFVIEQGDWQDTTAFLDQMPREACNHIRKVHITFTTKDSLMWDQWLQEPEEVEIVERPETVEDPKFEYGYTLDYDKMPACLDRFTVHMVG
ncbi:MAG: hypothetical protein Q9201_003018 [Fulgogasparrea decipioides]